MIIMINGPFGVGKTSVAKKLVTMLPNSMLYDPEEVGFMVRNITEGVRSEAENTGDFQDIPLWRTLTVAVAGRLQECYGRCLIIPMTLANPAYFCEIRDGLRQFEGPLFHFCLTASVTTIHKRLLERGERLGSWAFQQTERCLLAQQMPLFAEHIDSETCHVNQITNYILEQVN